ncbi:hypothetical protein AG1IA_09059 [Rhizoctonia solani AG-1 IA]|uniref:Uncharacterized protein n=1 Tax=Thanatephorus cucumeris (strain AG1-IA) TaxID=983506 RepID=L8WJL0_THACA|nr:hypothetical protein AG1IA_09059 [Rhizoctonia solani AG-1 IA]
MWFFRPARGFVVGHSTVRHEIQRLGLASPRMHRYLSCEDHVKKGTRFSTLRRRQGEQGVKSKWSSPRGVSMT